MKITIPTNHNYYEEQPLVETTLKDSFGITKSKQLKKLKEESGKKIVIISFEVKNNGIPDWNIYFDSINNGIRIRVSKSLKRLNFATSTIFNKSISERELKKIIQKK